MTIHNTFQIMYIRSFTKEIDQNCLHMKGILINSTLQDHEGNNF